MLWDDFLNSEWRDWRGRGMSEDRLDKPEWLEQWLNKHHLSVSIPPAAGEIETLKRFRAWLLRYIQKIVAGSELDPQDLGQLNQVMAEGRVIRQIRRNGDSYTIELAAIQKDWSQVMAEIASSFAQTLAEGERSRFRICDNPDCLWVYYDDTRNRSKRYCEDKSCGNLMKVRRFRARKKAEAGKRPEK